MMRTEDRPHLTEKQSQIISFIRQFSEEHGFPPSVREIGIEFQIRSPNGVMCHLKALERKHYIRRGEHLARAIYILDEKSSTELPIVGTIPAGPPWRSELVVEALHLGMLTQGQRFAVRIVGESMRDAGIFNGDLAIIRSCAEARDGQIVAAEVDGEVTLKRFFRESATVVRLEPCNILFEPIFAEEVRILGVYVGLLRLDV